eukprot:TRINITY_DN2700_c0_g1_i4.p4 TRINITY_DN2700_c0_g1~~TRINITY_DN2700_c0_g1_i4.p4  ORF type:complete len:176 (-),score=5.38 TRINITY_DN2700_c0_g1_i4:416-943(-)
MYKDGCTIDVSYLKKKGILTIQKQFQVISFKNRYQDRLEIKGINVRCYVLIEIIANVEQKQKVKQIRNKMANSLSKSFMLFFRCQDQVLISDLSDNDGQYFFFFFSLFVYGTNVYGMDIFMLSGLRSQYIEFLLFCSFIVSWEAIYDFVNVIQYVENKVGKKKVVLICQVGENIH